MTTCFFLERYKNNFYRLIFQEASFRKAVNDEEVPVKMKHVRNLIIGTFTDKNAELFWRNVAVCPPISTDVTAWKFCHCLHVVFRDGHPNVLRDSQRHINRIKDIGQHFVSSYLWCFETHECKFHGMLYMSFDVLIMVDEILVVVVRYGAN